MKATPARPHLRGAAPHPRPERVLRVGELEIDTVSRDVRVAGRPVRVAAKEYDLLVLMAGATRALSTAKRLLWGALARVSTPA